MNQYRIFYYISPSGENIFRSFLDSLSEKSQRKILRIFQYIKEYGLAAILQHTKKITGTPLWEIRILGKDNIRVFYAVPMKNSVIVLHGFVKKSQKTPKKELSKAISYYQEWTKRNHLDK